MIFLMVMFVLMLFFLFLVVIIVFQLAESGREAVGAAFHGIEDGLAAEAVPGRRDDARLRIQFADDGGVLRQFLLVDILRLGENHAGSRRNLVVEELAEVLVVDPAAGRIDDCGVAVQFGAVHALDDAQDIGQLADSGRFNQDVIRVIGVNHLAQGLLEIALQRAADAAGVDLVDLNAGFLQETAVNADLAEFIFHQDHFLAREHFFQQLRDQSRLARSQEAGYHVNLVHSYPYLLSAVPLYNFTSIGQAKCPETGRFREWSPSASP